MANDATMVIKTTTDTKELIKQTANRLGLSINSFVIMVAKNAAESDEIVIKNEASDSDYLAMIERAEKCDAKHSDIKPFSKLKAEYLDD
jgi:uncharacterized protein (DUF1778 family)